MQIFIFMGHMLSSLYIYIDCPVPCTHTHIFNVCLSFVCSFIKILFFSVCCCRSFVYCRRRFCCCLYITIIRKYSPVSSCTMYTLAFLSNNHFEIAFLFTLHRPKQHPFVCDVLK